MHGCYYPQKHWRTNFPHFPSHYLENQSSNVHSLTIPTMISEGKIPFKVGNETYHTWYKLYGDLQTSKHRPVVTLHGGPGVSHHYML